MCCHFYVQPYNMEKQAVVKVGKSPSIESGLPSTFVKNGHAFAAGEKDKISAEENRLAKQLGSLYNVRRDG